jgi:hypothetical protein
MKVVRQLFILGTIAIPFSGIGGLRAMGEMRTELSAYLYLLAIFVAAIYVLQSMRNQQAGSSILIRPYLLSQIFFVVISVLAISFMANFFQITTDTFRERSGLAKFISSTMVILYGFGLAHVTYHLANERWPTLILRPVALSVMICVLVGALELAAKYGYMTGIYDALSNVIHTGFGSYSNWPGSAKWELNWDSRLRSVAFEPPALANFCGYAWPWILCGVMNNRGIARSCYGLILILLSALIILAGARTGYVMLAGNIIVYGLLRLAYLPQKPGAGYRSYSHIITFLLGAVVVVVMVLVAVGIGPVIDNIVAGDKESNISRLASQLAAYAMFFDHLFFGVGLGQYGFHLSQYLPYWGYYSWELLPWLIYPDAPWPAVYSIYARLAGELGLLGLVGWPLLWIGLACRVVRSTRLYQTMTGNQLPPLAYPLVMSCTCVLMAGIATDTFRTPMIWLSLGLICRYLFELRLYLQNFTKHADDQFSATTHNPVIQAR